MKACACRLQPWRAAATAPETQGQIGIGTHQTKCGKRPILCKGVAGLSPRELQSMEKVSGGIF